MSSTVSIWEKIDLVEYAAAQAAAKTPKKDDEPEAPKTGWQKAKHSAYWWTLKAAGIMFWIYVPLKLFVGDLDRWVVDNIAPSLRWILDYRFFAFLVLLSLGLLLLRRWIYLAAISYVLFFPFLVTFYYLPRLLVRQRTWAPTVGVLNVLWLSLRSIRYTVVAGTVFALCALVVAVDGWNWMQFGAVATLLALWAVLIMRAIWSAVRPASFIQAQQRSITTLMKTKPVLKLASPAEAHLRPEIVKLTKTEVDQVVMTASVAVCVYASGHFLAEQLERYRKSGAAVIFSVVGVGALFAQAIAIFTLANVGIYQISTAQYEVTAEPSFATFVRYSLNSMFPGDINAIQPAGDAATWVSTYAGVSVAIILLTLVIALVFSVRSTREDVAADEAIAEMRVRSDEYASRVVTEYRLPLEELIVRLMEMGGLVNLWLRFVSRSIGEFRHDADAT